MDWGLFWVWEVRATSPIPASVSPVVTLGGGITTHRVLGG